jgi:hypothetical protein
MVSDYTPGPWSLEDSDHIHGPGGYHVTSLIARGADARLIAAAPDLLEALEQLINATDTYDRPIAWAWGDGEPLTQAREAIAKATGEHG